MKTCKQCKKEKNLSEFYKHKRMVDGHLSFCKSCKRNDSSVYYHNNKEKVVAYQARPAIKKKRALTKQQWDMDNKKYVVKYRKDYLPYRNQQRRERYANEPEYRILVILRVRLYDALKGACKSAKTIELLGCTIKELKNHIENLFQQGMSWENQGKWHIDHIKPCASFDLIDSQQQRECFNYTNLQPLWAVDNLLKNKKELF